MNLKDKIDDIYESRILPAYSDLDDLSIEINRLFDEGECALAIAIYTHNLVLAYAGELPWTGTISKDGNFYWPQDHNGLIEFNKKMVEKFPQGQYTEVG